MSVIAWDGKTLAADRAVSCSGTVWESRKSRQMDNGDILAWCRTIESGLMVADWYENGAQVRDWPECQNDKESWANLIVVDAEGCFEYEQRPVKQRVYAPCLAWGSGAELALGAMLAGASAKEAVLIANIHDDGCGFGVDVYRRSAK